MAPKAYFISFDTLIVTDINNLDAAEVQVKTRQQTLEIHKIIQKDRELEIILASPINFEAPYVVVLNPGELTIPICTLRLINAPEFEARFYYSGPLGPVYHPEQTTFRIWAPLSCAVEVCIFQANDHSLLTTMPLDRQANGVFSATIKGDWDKKLYQYQIHHFNGEKFLVSDPYSLATSDNSNFSVILDFSQKIPVTKLPASQQIRKNTEAIIYETSVRDFTSDIRCPSTHHGKFLGLIETGDVTTKISGLNHLRRMGVTHLQLLPVHDFLTTNENDIASTYNWGYDTVHYFALENSYMSNPYDPMTGINEFQMMINCLHNNGIGVNIDVVYNHLYCFENTNLEKILPGYYFRFQADGKTPSNGTLVGNELASERAMVARLIKDSVRHLIDGFGVDGLRFDLMGILDRQLMEDLAAMAQHSDHYIMLYGEGWKMPSVYPEGARATLDAASQLPDIGFFNDLFRDLVRGHSPFHPGGYLVDDLRYYEGFQYAYMGSCIDYLYRPRFLKAGQSINYVECHDNHTLFDWLSLRHPEAPESDILKRLELINMMVILAFGIPFIHMGQEIGQSKNKQDNTYNAGDLVNQLNYDLLLKRAHLVTRLAHVIKLRRQHPNLELENPDEIRSTISFHKMRDDGSVIRLAYNIFDDAQFARLEIYLNLSPFSYWLESLSSVYCYDIDTGAWQELKAHSREIPALSLCIMKVRK